jgi:polysaccharide pyruvyl transferase WcaK-like protein
MARRRTPRGAGQLILVTDGWLANAGDAAIYMAMRESLHGQLPGARIAFSCHHRDLVGDRYPELDQVPPLDPLAGVEWPWTSKRDLAERETIEQLVEEADVVLAPGGGRLLERYRPEGRLRIYEELLARDKRLMFYAQSIGRFNDPELHSRMSAILEAAELVLLRDEPSHAVVLEQRRPENVHLTADEALLLGERRRWRRRTRGERPRSLLVTVTSHPWLSNDGDAEIEKEQLEAIGGSLARLLEAGTVESVCLASTTQGLGGPELALEDDAEPAWAVQHTVPWPLQERVEWRTEYVSASEYMQLAASHGAVISMRMHGAILATVAGAPVLLANASAKARSLCARTGGGITGIESTDDLGRLDELVPPLLADVRRLSRQEAGLHQVRALAKRNAPLVAERLAAA